MNEWHNLILAVSVVIMAEIANEIMIFVFRVRNAQTRFRIRLISLFSCFFVFLVLPLKIVELTIIPSGKDFITNVQNSPEFLGVPATLAFRLSRFAWISIVLVIASAICLLAMFLFSKIIVSRVAGCVPVSDPQLLALVEEVSQEMGVTVKNVVISRRKCDAFVYGYPPTLAVGSDLLELLDEEELRIVIRHELHHIKGYDTLLKPIVTALCIVFMYNPMVWFLSRRLSADRECCADVGSITTSKDAQAFLSLLLKFHDFKRANSYPLAVHWVGAANRIDSLFFREKARKIPVFACLFVTVSLLFLSGTHLFDERYIEIGRSDITSYASTPNMNLSQFFIDIPLVEWSEKKVPDEGVKIPLLESELLELLKVSRIQEGGITVRLGALPIGKRRQLFGGDYVIDVESDCRLVIDPDNDGHLFVHLTTINSTDTTDTHTNSLWITFEIT